MAGKCVVTMVMMASLVCLLRDQTGVLSAPMEPESVEKLQIAEKFDELETNMLEMRQTMTAFKGILGDLGKRLSTLEIKFKESQEKDMRETNDFLERLDNMETFNEGVRADMVIFKRMGGTVLALEEGHDNLQAALATTNNNLEAALNTSIERTEVLKMVDSIVLRVESLESKTVSADQLHEDLIEAVLKIVPVVVPRTTISVKVVSAGNDDPGYLGGRGEVWVDGVQYAMNGRGYNLVIVNEMTGQMEDSVLFDTYYDPAAGVSLRDFLRGVPIGRIVLIAVHDEGSRYSGDAMAELNSLGAFSPDIAYRTSWAMISKKGSKTSWFVEDERDRYAGPTVVEAEIPLTV